MVFEVEPAYFLATSKMLTVEFNKSFSGYSQTSSLPMLNMLYSTETKSLAYSLAHSLVYVSALIVSHTLR